MLKNFFSIISFLFFCVITLFAQERVDVLLKFNQEADLMRVVFETDEAYVNRAKITTSLSQIKIEFPGEYKLLTDKKPPFEIMTTEKALFINLEEKNEVKFFKLTSPPRLVFDIQKKDSKGEKYLRRQNVTQEAEKILSPTIPKVYVIDSGHGGYDFGITYGDTNEKNVTLNLGRDLRTALIKKGKTVFLVRKVDQYISISDRIQYINKKRPDVFISLHTSISKNFVLNIPKFEDLEIKDIVELYSITSRQKKYIEKSKFLSESIGKALKEEFGKEIILREMPLPILNSVAAPSVMIEIPSPKFLTYNQEVSKKIIDSIINGLMLYEK